MMTSGFCVGPINEDEGRLRGEQVSGLGIKRSALVMQVGMPIRPLSGDVK